MPSFLFNSNESTVLCKLLSDHFPEFESKLAFFESSFDRGKAKEEGIIIPNKGVHVEYDAAQEAVELLLNKLDRYLTQQRRRLNCKVG